VQKAAAEILGISRRTLWSKIKQYGIEIKKGG
jgi:transcriptional regulator of acetoin/glycerol metabolism